VLRRADEVDTESVVCTVRVMLAVAFTLAGSALTGATNSTIVERSGAR